MINTIETRLSLDTIENDILTNYVNNWSYGYRKTWSLYNHQQLSENDVYHKLSSLNRFTAHQINSLIHKVKNEHSKIKELTKTQLKQTEDKLTHLHKFIIKEQKLINKNTLKINSSKQKIKLTQQKLYKVNLQNELTKKDKYESELKALYLNISTLTKTIQKKEFVIKQKQIKINKLTQRINLFNKRIQTNKFKLCFGSSDLLKQHPKHHSNQHRIDENQQVYTDVSEWTFDWKLARNNIVFSIGRKDDPNGNKEIQYYPDSKIVRIRLDENSYLQRLQLIADELNITFDDLNDNKIIKHSIHRMKARFIEINDVEFTVKNQQKIIHAINNKQPITAKIIKKLTAKGHRKNSHDVGFYLQLSFDEATTPLIELSAKPLTMGVDLNEKGLAYCIVNSHGNKLKSKKELNNKNNEIKHKSYGFLEWDLKDKSSEQRQWIISNTITKLLEISQSYGVYSIAIENLNFSSTLSQMNNGYKENQTYNHMLSQFSKNLFKNLIQRKTERLGITLNIVNASYSSIGGYVKYGLINKLPTDIAASLWLARQSLYGEKYKVTTNIIYKKKYNEKLSLPYELQPKQSNKLNEIEVVKEWKDMTSILKSYRKYWYKNLINSSKLKQYKTQPLLEIELLYENLFQDPDETLFKDM